MRASIPKRSSLPRELWKVGLCAEVRDLGRGRERGGESGELEDESRLILPAGMQFSDVVSMGWVWCEDMK